jgi:adenine-specific DNA-methyltransferase
MIFVSIDDHEVHHLRQLLDDIFGAESWLGTIVWKRRQVSDNRNVTNVSVDHEYMLCYGHPTARLFGANKDLSKYRNPDNDPRGSWMSDNLTGLATKEQRPNLHYDIVNPETGDRYPPLASRGWAYGPETMTRLIADRRIIWPSSLDGRPRLKRFQDTLRSDVTGFSTFRDFGFTTDGTREVTRLLGEKQFDFAKPVAALKEICKQSTSPDGNDIILDFFAGSCTTAQAVLELNDEDGGDRSFVMVQLPERLDDNKYATIADVGRERIKRVIAERESGTELINQKRSSRLGFKLLRLDRSNFKIWDGNSSEDADGLARQIAMHIDHLSEASTASDVLYELLLKAGFPLTTKVKAIKLASKEVFSIEDGALLICLEKESYPIGARDRGAFPAGERARRSQASALRQRPGVRVARVAQMDRRSGHRHGVDRTRQALAEWRERKLQRQVPR